MSRPRGREGHRSAWREVVARPAGDPSWRMTTVGACSPSPFRPAQPAGSSCCACAPTSTSCCAARSRLKARYRVTGLAAEAAFFALLSLPPLLMGLLVGTLGYLAEFVGSETVDKVQQTILEAAGTVLSEEGVNQVLAPTLSEILDQGRPTSPSSAR